LDIGQHPEKLKIKEMLQFNALSVILNFKEKVFLPLL